MAHPKPIGDQCKADQAQEHHVQLLESGEDVAKSFQSPEESLDLIAPFVELTVAFLRRDVVRLGWHDRNEIQIQCELACFTALGSLIHHKLQLLRPEPSQQLSSEHALATAAPGSEFVR